MLSLRRAWVILGLSLAAITTVWAGKLEPTLADREKMGREARQAFSLLEDYHYAQRKISQTEPTVIIRDTLGELDYHRMFFTEAEIKKLTEHYDGTLHSAYLSRGDLYPAVDFYNRYYTNAKARFAWIKKRLAGKFDFTTRDRFAPDRSKADWPKTPAEADTLWTQRLTHELLLELLNSTPLDEAKAKLLKRYDRSERLLEEFDLKDLQTTFITSIAHTYDPHSNFFSNDDLEDFSISMSNKLVGIGALLKDEDGYCVVQSLIPGGPAENSGLIHIGDKIVEVAQDKKDPVDVVDLRINKIVKLIRGAIGSNVVLTIIPADATDASTRKKITLVRDEVRLTENLASAQVVEVPDGDKGTIPVGVVELPSFYGGTDNTATTSEDIKELIGKLQGMGIKGLVLDLRRNGGGLLNEAVAVVGIFVPKAPVVQVRDGVGNVRVDWDKDAGVLYDGPLVVLTSRMSASASEIVAGALQSMKRAVVVGDKASHGKGTVQAIFEIDRGLLAQFSKRPPTGGIKVTIQKFYLPDGASTQNKGVASDVALPSINDVLPIGESDLPHALAWDSIPAAQWDYKTGWENVDRLDAATTEYLLCQSQKRRLELPEFAYLNEVIGRLKLRQEEKAVWINYDLRLREKQLDEKFKQTSEKRREELAKDRFDSADVLLDISWKMKAEHQAKLQSSLLPNGRTRAGAAYENVYYHPVAGGTEIREVKADTIDYEAVGAHSQALAGAMGVSRPQVEELIKFFKQADERSECNITAIFEKAFGKSVAAEKLPELTNKFFETLITLKPEIAEEHPSLDIPLREALRVAADWASVNQSALLKPAAAEPAAVTAAK